MSPTPGQIKRNDPCPCGSGKKYKKCCLGKTPGPEKSAAPPPESYQQQIRQAADHMRSGRWKPAESLLRQVLQRKPNQPDAVLGLAQVLDKTRRVDQAIALLERAIADDRPRASYHVSLGHLLLGAGRIEEAEACVRRAVALDPHSEAAHKMAAECHHRMRRVDEAIVAIERALSINPDSAEARLFLVALHKDKGEPQEARRELERIVASEQRPEVLYWALKELGFLLDECAEYDRAFEMFERGGAVTAMTADAQGIDRDEPLRLIEGYKAHVTTDLVSRWKRDDFDDRHRRPTFFVGFPRSGTTMTEQVLAAHPDIVTADERPLLGDVKRAMSSWFAGEALPSMIGQLDAGEITKLRALYWQRSGEEMGCDLSDKVFVDKLPLNLIDVGLINVVFPEARLIVALRDPRDVCLSCFMQRFGLNPYMINYLWWERTAAFYAAVMGLWLHQRELITLDRLEVRYEDTVGDLQRQARRMLDFLELPWNDAVLSFHQKARQRFISTPSFEAVSERVHTRARGRWHNYAGHLDRVAETLQPFVEAFGYD